jgi:hypothetical protein
MRIALGLDVDAVPAFAAVLPLDAGARPTTLAVADGGDPVPGRIDSIIDSTREVIADLTAREGDAPVAVALVHPLAWDASQVQRLHRALVRAELSDVRVLTTATAAAVGTDALHPVANGRRVTVVALRPDGAEVQALRKDGEHSFRELGAPTPVAGITEGQLDAILLGLVEAKLPGRLPASREDPALQLAFAALGDAVHQARERLCSEESAIVGVRLPGRAAVIQVQREEFEAAAAPLVATMLPALVAAVHQAGASTGGMDRLVLTGTAAPTPLLAELLAAELGIPVVVAGPRDSGSIGAAWAAGAAAAVAPVVASLVAAVSEEPVGATAAASTVPVTPLDEFGEPDPTTERRRRPLTLLQLWPITAAAAVLVALAGTVSSGVLDLTPAGSHPTSPATAPADPSITTEPDAVSTFTPEPTPVAVVTAPAAPATPVAGTTTKKRPGKGATSPAVPVVPVTPPDSSSPGPTPDPSMPPADPSMPPADASPSPSATS